MPLCCGQAETKVISSSADSRHEKCAFMQHAASPAARGRPQGAAVEPRPADRALIGRRFLLFGGQSGCYAWRPARGCPHDRAILPAAACASLNRWPGQSRQGPARRPGGCACHRLCDAGALCGSERADQVEHGCGMALGLDVVERLADAALLVDDEGRAHDGHAHFAIFLPLLPDAIVLACLAVGIGQ